MNFDTPHARNAKGSKKQNRGSKLASRELSIYQFMYQSGSVAAHASLLAYRGDSISTLTTKRVMTTAIVIQKSAGTKADAIYVVHLENV
jgi:hypothetical protein